MSDRILKPITDRPDTALLPGADAVESGAMTYTEALRQRLIEFRFAVLALEAENARLRAENARLRGANTTMGQTIETLGESAFAARERLATAERWHTVYLAGLAIVTALAAWLAVTAWR